MGAIFLSYAREDRACAESLARVLEQAGHTVWWDRHIDGGSDFATEIEAELDKADVVLVAWSKTSVRSRWVRDEAAVGGDTGRLVPVSVDGVQAPMGFRQFHTLDLNGWKGAENDKRIGEILHTIKRRLTAKSEPGLAAAQAPPPKQLPAFWRRKAFRVSAAALVLLVAGALAFFLLEPDRLRGPPPRPTIALAPFTQTSADADLRELASQTRDSIAHTLSQSGMPVRSLNSLPQEGDRPAGDFLISGELSRKLDKVVATIRLDEVAHGVTVYSQQFEAGREDVGDLPERIGAQIAASLTWAAVLMVLDRRHPSDPAILTELLRDAAFTSDYMQGYQISQRVAAKAPDSAIAQLGLAFNTGFVLHQIPRPERTQALAAARRAADRAQVLAPEFGDVYGPWCFLHSETRRVECEDRLRGGKRIDPDAPFLNNFLSQVLRNVGRLDEAVELTRLSYVHDPYVPTKIDWMLRMLEYAGESDEGRSLYQQGVRWWPEYKDSFFRNRMIGLLDRGDFNAVELLEREVGLENLPAGYPKSGPLVAAVKLRSLAGVKRICIDAENFLLMVRCMLAFAKVGDLDGAYGVADKLFPVRIGRTPAETERIWLDDPGAVGTLEFVTSPAAAPMRRDPRYLQLVQRVGLLDYWRSGRAPDFCRKQPEPICKHLLKRS